MSIDTSIVEFLCRDENLALAMEVADAVDKVHKNIEGRFLDLLEAAITSGLKRRAFARRWTPQRYHVDITRTYESYAGIYLNPLQGKSALGYGAILWREGAEYQIYYGLEWTGSQNSNEQPKGFPTKESGPLITFLDDHEFKRSKWTLGWKTVASFKSRKEMTLALHQRSGELVQTLVRDFLNFIEQTEAMVRATNQSLCSIPSKR
jgi:hypothetical protein